MTQEEKRLLSDLTDAIQNWMNAESDGDEWTRVNEYVGDQTASFMADAAFSVLLGIAEAQRHAVREGYLKEN